MDVSQNILLLLLLLLVVRAVATAAAVAVHSDQTRQWEVRQLLDVQTTTSSISEKCECVCVCTAPDTVISVFSFLPVQCICRTLLSSVVLRIVF